MYVHQLWLIVLHLYVYDGALIVLTTDSLRVRLIRVNPHIRVMFVDLYAHSRAYWYVCTINYISKAHVLPYSGHTRIMFQPTMCSNIRVSCVYPHTHVWFLPCALKVEHVSACAPQTMSHNLCMHIFWTYRHAVSASYAV